MPGCVYLERIHYLLVWIYHFIAVFLCDVITKGAILNPAMSLALYINGDISFEKSLVLSVAQYAAGPVAFILLKLCIPILRIEGPNNYMNGSISQRDIIEGAYYEGIGMMIFTIIILASSKYIKSVNVNRGITAITLRVLIVLNTKTGAWLNPMMGFGWVFFVAGSMNSSNLNANNPTLFVYCLSPSVGACIGSLVFAVFEYLMPMQPSAPKKITTAIDKSDSVSTATTTTTKATTLRESDFLSPKRAINRIKGNTPTPLKTPKVDRGRSKSPASSKRKSARSKTPTKKR